MIYLIVIHSLTRAANKQVIFVVMITEGDESSPRLVSKPEF
jgi:hypothetical protein